MLFLAAFFTQQPGVAATLAIIAVVLGVVAFRRFTARTRRRFALLQQPLPTEDIGLLEEQVAYYNCLEPADQKRFQQLVQVFLAETPITGIDVEVTPLHRILVAASAVIPIMGLPHWEYAYLSEVLLYPAHFNADYESGDGEDNRILGLVHGSLSNGVVILSAPALISGFANPHDRRNVGIHEFAHMVDKRDGSIDGVAAALPRDLIAPWRNLMREKMAEDQKGRGAIDPYAHTNEQEFLAVTTEYFFENPERLAREHPRVYAKLSTLYGQDPATLLTEEYRFLRRKPLGRNDPCPCGSRRKYKRCCLPKKKA
nr:zinc-dependent peptidase [Acanthopleuribacter pedis]